jgi:hypothetical protein
MYAGSVNRAGDMSGSHDVPVPLSNPMPLSIKRGEKNAKTKRFA